MFKKSCCQAKELSVLFQRVSNIQLYIHIYNLHLIDGHIYTHIYKIDDTENKREEEEHQNCRQLEELCFEKKKLLKFAIQINIYIW